MRNTITLNGIESSEIAGLLIQSLPPISKPLMRTEIEEIDGRDGDIVTPLGFSAYDKEFIIGLYGDFDINQVIAYFNSKGTVVFSNEPDKYYNYQIINQIDFERLLRYRTATVTMHCQPFKYSTTEGADILSGSENFATLDQSLNTDTSFYTYTSNVQDDVTATRNGTANNGKFFAVFTIPVVQGITYHFSGNVASKVTMYAYTNQLRGTSAGIAGKALTSNFTYTATFTGTMVLGFYAGLSTEIFIRNFFVTNEAGATVSGEGNNIVLENTSEAPFSQLDLKGDTSQMTYTGKNLLLATSTGSAANGILATNNSDGTATLSGTGTGSQSSAPFSDMTTNLPAGTYTFSITETLPFRTLLRAPDLGQNIWVIEAGQTSVTATISSDVTQLRVWLYQVEGVSVDKTLGFQLEEGSTATAFEPYVGGVASPNPDYPQDINVVTDAQTVTVHGKNIFDKDNANLIEGYFDGSSATSTINIGSTGRNRIVWLPCKPNTTYSFLCTDLTGMNVGWMPQIGTTEELPAGGVTVTRLGAMGTSQKLENMTTPANAKYLVARFQTKNSSVNINNVMPAVLAGFQIEEGATATAYEAYQQQSYEINLGKNLFDKSNVILYKGYFAGATAKLSAVSSDLTSGGDRFLYMECEPNTTYTITKPIQSTTANNRFSIGTQSVLDVTSGAVLSDFWNGGDGTTITTRTITTGNDAHYLFIYIGKATTSTNPGGQIQDILDGLQVEKGSAATSYAPYFEPIELCKIGDYQDYFYKDGDDWYVHKEINKATLPTSGYSRWSTQPTACMYYKNGALSDALFQTGAVTAVIKNLVVQPQVTNMTAYYNDYAQTNKYGFVLKTDTPGIMIQNKDTAGIDDFHTWISSNPIEVRYVLATPTNTVITNSTLIEQLEAVSNAHSYKPITYINATSDGTNLPHIIAATTAGNMDGTITNSGNTTARPKLTLFGSGNIGIYLNGVQIFQIALGTEGYITIDTNAMEAYKDTTDNLKNRLVTGDYSNFVLKVGANQISFSGNTTMCVVENYSRWL